MATLADDLQLASQCQQKGDLRRAEQLYRQALRVDANNANVWSRLAGVLEEMGSSRGSETRAEREYRQEAVAAYEALLKLRPEDTEARNRLGVVLAELHKFDEAMRCFREVVRLDPKDARPHNNLGAALSDLGRYSEALTHYEQAIELWPDYAEAHKSRALTWLVQGNYEQGWPEFEWRWQCKGFTQRNFPQLLWDGKPFDGKTILLHTEQGTGDTIQFIRYAPLVKEQGGRVVLECPQGLIPLLKSCRGIDSLVGQGAQLPAFDVHAPLMTLPRLFGTTLANVPVNVPNLAAEPERTERWQRELAPIQAFKVGVFWKGNPRYAGDYRRSPPLEHFAPLTRIPGVRLFSLQKGPGSEQLNAIAARFPVTDLGSRADLTGGAFLDTAAIMHNLDLIISSDTAGAHLAGALGVPTWVPLCAAPDWRWLLHGERTVWYPTMRLFRQTELGQWKPVFDRMATALWQLVASQRG